MNGLYDDERCPDDLLLQGVVDGTAENDVVAHAAACEACAEMVEGWRALMGGLDRLEDPRPDDVFVPQVMHRIAEVEAARETHRSRLWVVSAVVVALAGAVLGGGLAWFGELPSLAGVGTGLGEVVSSTLKTRLVAARLLEALPSGVGILVVVAQFLFLALLVAAFRHVVGGASTQQEITR